MRGRPAREKTLMREARSRNGSASPLSAVNEALGSGKEVPSREASSDRWPLAVIPPAAPPATPMLGPKGGIGDWVQDRVFEGHG